MATPRLITAPHELPDMQEVKKLLLEGGVSPELADKAAKQLANKPDARDAALKVIPALREKTVNVFFSYKAKDRMAATAVVRILRKYSADKLQICYQAEFGEEITGQKWREKIKREIDRANWFILLLPDPSDDWDWCLYETGLFDRNATSSDRMICLHHPHTDIPDAIKDYHHVAATTDEVEAFLRMVFLNDNPLPGLSALNRNLTDEIPKIAQEIVDAVRPPKAKVIHKVCEPWIKLRIEDAAKLAEGQGLENVRIEEANPSALRLFDYLEAPATLGKLCAEMSNEDGVSRCWHEVSCVVRKIAEGRDFRPVQSVFKAKEGRFYKPIVHAVDRAEKGNIVSLHLTFSEDVSSMDGAAVPPELGTLAAVLRHAFRFRWEILEQFGTSSLTLDDLKCLNNSLQRLNRDWESKGLGPSAILDALPDHRQKIEEMMDAWARVKNREGTGTLDRAIKDENIEAIPSILNGFLPLNREFLEMAAEHFSELLKVRPKKG